MKQDIMSHPGEILEEEFLTPLGLTGYTLAKATGISKNTIYRIIRGEQPITPKTAYAFAAFFETSPEFWVNLQSHYDLVMEKGSFDPPETFQTARQLAEV